MWDSSLPSYTGSFEDNIILFTIYIRYVLFYVAAFFGLLLMLSPIVFSVVVSYFGIKSLKIQIKHKKKKDTIHIKSAKKYMDHLEQKIHNKK